MIPRPGRSWHLPSGGALYFDTGVIEVATPVVEIGEECAIRVVRSLWEQIAFVRSELDAWEKTKGVSLRLEGFSTHYNVSVPGRAQNDAAATRQLALLLLYLLHAPVMLLAANRRSTGVGVRPRDGRIEVTADFTPDPDLMTANAALITGVTLAVAGWPAHGLDQIEARGIPVIGDFAHRRHTSRKGFLARFDCFAANPFATDPNVAMWTTSDGRGLSLRQIAGGVSSRGISPVDKSGEQSPGLPARLRGARRQGQVVAGFCRAAVQLRRCRPDDSMGASVESSTASMPLRASHSTSHRPPTDSHRLFNLPNGENAGLVRGCVSEHPNRATAGIHAR